MNDTSCDQATVVAQATPPGEGGLAVVRVSGPKALAVAARVFRGRGFGASVESHRAVFGELIRPEGNCTDIANSDTGQDVIDRVLALPLLAPRSYTGEDTVEFFCHGGRIVAAEVVAACCAAGASPAPPGEFTRRAFLNGKLSLDQAEAVADLIHAGDQRAAKGAVGQLLGGLDRELRLIEKPLLALLAELEGSLEFAAEEDFLVPAPDILKSLDCARAKIDQLLQFAPAGRLLREGVQVVLVGPPNVGKSSLFNALLEEQRAIVDGTPGTTRDVVSARVVRRGQSYVLHDTAGLRPDGDVVERKGMALTRATQKSADIILQLFPAGENPEENSTAEAPATGPEPSIPVVGVRTKCDLTEPKHSQGLAVEDPSVVWTSSHTGQGLEELWAVIENVTADFHIDEALSLGVVLNDRHRARLKACREELAELITLQKNGVETEVTASILAGVLAGLGEVSGRVFTEQLLDSIFRRFCVGK